MAAGRVRCRTRAVSNFSLQWLSLREPLDAASRAAQIGAGVRELLRPRRSAAPVQIVDLGAGAGSNLRYVVPLLGGSQDWSLVDRDVTLLDAVMGQMQAWASASVRARVVASDQQITISASQFECRIRRICLNLATDLDRLVLPNDALVSASALLDLVSESWLRTLAARAAHAAATVWFALSYDGRIGCRPAEPEDPEVRELFNAHQLTDKGFGAALGPAAGRVVEQVFKERGYRTWCAPSDWRIGPTQQRLQHALIDGWCDAACELAPHRTPQLRHWQGRRRAHIDAGRSQLLVGHVDMAGCPY